MPSSVGCVRGEFLNWQCLTPSLATLTTKRCRDDDNLANAGRGRGRGREGKEVRSALSGRGLGRGSGSSAEHQSSTRELAHPWMRW